MIDLGPVHVRGALRARYARLIWSEGTLHIVNRHNGGLQHQTVETSEPVAPTHRAGIWRTRTTDGRSITWSSKGCATCGSPYKGLGSIPAAAILEGDPASWKVPS